MDLLIGWLLGVCTTLLGLNWVVRRYIKNKLAMRQLIAEMYHKDLLPEICRVEGLISLTVREFKDDELAMIALKEIRTHKEKVLAIIRKYEPFQ